MFHGTSSAHLERVLAEGLRPPTHEAERLSAAVAEDHDPHLASLNGVYVAASVERCEVFAKQSVERHGGEPMIAVLLIDPLDTVPDEDHILEFLSNYGEDLPRIFGDEGFLERWRDEQEFRERVATKIAEDLVSNLEHAEADDVAKAMYDLLDFGISAMDDEALQDTVERNCHHLSPALLESAIYRDDGLPRYRELMDALARTMRGTKPYYDSDSHSLRLPRSVAFKGRTRVIDLGTPEDPFSFFAGELEDVRDLIEEAGIALPKPLIPA